MFFFLLTDPLSKFELIGSIECEYSSSLTWSLTHRKATRRLQSPESVTDNKFANKFECRNASGTG